MINLKKIRATANNSNQPSGVKTLAPKEFKNMSVEEFKNLCKFYEYNRGTGTDLKRAESIADSIYYNNTWWMVQAVVIDRKTKTVLDGNHTGTACLILKEKYGIDAPIPVQIEPLPKEVSVPKAVQDFNNNRKGWQLEDYIITYAKEGNENYIRLINFANSLDENTPFIDKKQSGKKIRWRYITALTGNSKQDSLREGTFKLTPEDVENYSEKAKEVTSIWEAAGKPKVSTWFEGFTLGYVEFMKIFNNAKLFNRIVKNASTPEGKALFDGSVSKEVWKSKFVDLYEM